MSDLIRGNCFKQRFSSNCSSNCFKYHLLRNLFLDTSRELKRIEAIARSQSLTHAAATVSGLSTIRSCGARQRTLAREFDKLLDLHSSAWTLVLNTNRAFGFWMDMVCCLYLAFVTFSFFLFVGSVKILVPNSTAGMIIDKGGNYSKQIKEQSGSYVQISRKAKELSLQERCITVVGEKENNKKPCRMILQKVVDDNYNPTGSPYAVLATGDRGDSLNRLIDGADIRNNSTGRCVTLLLYEFHNGSHPALMNCRRTPI